MSKSVIAISAFVGSSAALITCLIFFYFVYKPAQAGELKPSPSPVQTPFPTPPVEIRDPEIKASDVTSVSINTAYRGYFDAGNKCSKSYNEYFGNEDGIGSLSSPCTLKIDLNRDGHATRSIEVSRWDKTAKETRVVEKSDWTAEIPPDQFDALTETIVTNEAFKAWRQGTMINTSNCSITVNYNGGSKSVLSNVDERTTGYLPMVDAIKRVEKQLNWITTK